VARGRWNCAARRRSSVSRGEIRGSRCGIRGAPREIRGRRYGIRRSPRGRRRPRRGSTSRVRISPVGRLRPWARVPCVGRVAVSAGPTALVLGPRAGVPARSRDSRAACRRPGLARRAPSKILAVAARASGLLVAPLSRRLGQPNGARAEGPRNVPVRLPVTASEIIGSPRHGRRRPTHPPRPLSSKVDIFLSAPDNFPNVSRTPGSANRSPRSPRTGELSPCRSTR
jgi:hypothetical protein